eukprot:5348153-Amphidinium_carterae.2
MIARRSTRLNHPGHPTICHIHVLPPSSFSLAVGKRENSVEMPSALTMGGSDRSEGCSMEEDGRTHKMPASHSAGHRMACYSCTLKFEWHELSKR